MSTLLYLTPGGSPHPCHRTCAPFVEAGTAHAVLGLLEDRQYLAVRKLAFFMQNLIAFSLWEILLLIFCGLTGAAHVSIDTTLI
jgi:hypothetical protein